MGYQHVTSFSIGIDRIFAPVFCEILAMFRHSPDLSVIGNSFMAKAQFGRRGSGDGAISTNAAGEFAFRRLVQIGAAALGIVMLCYAAFEGNAAWKRSLNVTGAQGKTAAVKANEALTNRVIISSAEDEIRHMLKDGESARFSNVTWHKGLFGVIICGYVNSKNSFGAYAGESRFVVNYDANRRYLIERTNPSPEAVDAWDENCE